MAQQNPTPVFETATETDYAILNAYLAQPFLIQYRLVLEQATMQVTGHFQKRHTYRLKKHCTNLRKKLTNSQNHLRDEIGFLTGQLNNDTPSLADLANHQLAATGEHAAFVHGMSGYCEYIRKAQEELNSDHQRLKCTDMNLLRHFLRDVSACNAELDMVAKVEKFVEKYHGYHTFSNILMAIQDVADDRERFRELILFGQVVIELPYHLEALADQMYKTRFHRAAAFA